MKNNLILHGHFYQPPRENPETGLVPLQESAKPFHDWNYRITKECYGANSFSRYLNYDGRIEDITNNYEYLSFNFGPTLMNWLKANAPNVYRRIIEADKISMERNAGHGNAIAQGYNHTILPLDTPLDAELQIQWGLKDFESHFNRKSEGIWLPETAVNYNIIDILISKKIKFIILSPWQAEAIQTEDSEEWQLMGDQPVPSWRSYRIERDSGSIAVFFYNNILAQGISFGHYLRDAKTLYTRLTRLHSSRDASHLIHTATDGEIYGHHEPFGDMGLAALIKKIKDDDKFTLTNYGYYLEQHPPVFRAKLKQGEENKGTSWSCFHGVSRWYKDCGCNTGGQEGWNQKWRTPVRVAYETLSNNLSSIYNTEIKTISKTDPETILKEYINVLTKKESKKNFAERILGTKNNTKNRIKLYKLLEGQKFRMYTFTSCGWFFSELSGIEPVQNLKYAYRAIEIYSEFTDDNIENNFISILEEAKSNIKGTGKDIYLSIKPGYSGGLEAAINFLIQNRSVKNTENKNYGNFSLISLNENKINIIDRTTDEEFNYTFSTPGTNFEGLTFSPGNIEVTLGNLPENLRIDIAEQFMNQTEKMYNLYSSDKFPELKKAFTYTRTLNIPISETIMKTAEAAVYSQLKQILSDPQTYLSKSDMDTMDNLLSFVREFNINIDKKEISKRLSMYLAVQFDKPQTLINDFSIQYIFKLYEIARTGGIEPEVTIPQNIIFHHMEVWRKLLKDKRYHPDKDSTQVLRQLVAMGDILSINADDLKVFVQE